MNKYELSRFENWVLKQKIWITVLLSLFTYFIWFFIFLYCKYRENEVNKNIILKNEKMEKSKHYDDEEDMKKRINRKKDKLILHKIIKVSDTSHSERQKILKEIDFIVNHGDSPNISIDIKKTYIDIYYCEIDSENEKQIGTVNNVNDFIQYFHNIDYDVKFNFKIEHEKDAYVLYFEINIYN